MEGNVLVRKGGAYSRVPIPLVRNKEISNQAKIVYMQLASHDNGWIIYIKKLAGDCQMTEETLRKYIKELERHGYVNRERIKENGLLKGYTWELIDYPNQPNQQTTETEQMELLPDTKEKENKPHTKPRAVKKKYGKYNNVPFTDEQIEKLKAEFPNDWEERIEKVSSWADSKNKTVKDGLATIRNWARRENKTKQQPKEQPKQQSCLDNEEGWL